MKRQCKFYEFFHLAIIFYIIILIWSSLDLYTVPQCNQIISSDAGRNGSFSSPNYPHHYTPKTECRYLFIGHGRERVQITFTDFSLYHPSESNPESESTGTNNGSTMTNNNVYQYSYGPSYPGGETQTLLSVQRYLNGNRINDRVIGVGSPHQRKR